jgi:hypothetical protein
MALTANDLVIFYPQQSPVQPFPPPKGTVIVVGANPEIIWQNTGIRSVYTAIAAPVGVQRTTFPTNADFNAWIHQLVERTTENPSGRSRGVVREVLLVGDPPTTLNVIVETEDHQWYMNFVAGMRIVT